MAGEKLSLIKIIFNFFVSDHLNVLMYVHISLFMINLLIPALPNDQPDLIKLSVRTGNHLSWVSQNLFANKATGHPLTVECKQRKKSRIAHCGLHALEITNLNVVASNLLRTCFKNQSLPNKLPSQLNVIFICS